MIAGDVPTISRWRKGSGRPGGCCSRPGVFVVSHAEPERAPEGGVCAFVTGGIESTLEEAKADAGVKTVAVMGGAEIGRQYMGAGLVEEVGLRS